MLKLWKKGSVSFETSYRVRIEVPQNTFALLFDDTLGPFEMWVNGTKITDLNSIADTQTLKPFDLKDEIERVIGGSANLSKLFLLGFAAHDKRYAPGKKMTLELVGSLSSAKNINIYYLQDTRAVPTPYITMVKRLTRTGHNGDVEIVMYGWRNFTATVKDSSNNAAQKELKIIHPRFSGYVLETSTSFTYLTREVHKEANKLDEIRYIFKDIPSDHTIYFERLEIFPIGRVKVNPGNTGTEYLPGSPSSSGEAVAVK